MKRFLFGLILITLSFTTYWWLPVILCVFGLFYFKNFFEVIAVGFIIDILYLNQNQINHFNLIFTISMMVALFLITKFKKQIFI